MAKTLAELIEAQFGVRVRGEVNPEIATIGTTAAQIFKGNPNRLAFVVVNLSSNDLYISPDVLVSSTHGIQLVSRGGGYVALWNEDFHLVGYEWWCVGSASSTDFFSLEIETY